MMMRRATAALLAAALCLPALAENSEADASPEELAAKQAEPDMPEDLRAHLDYVDRLQTRLAGLGAERIRAIYESEGEQAALLYCRALGFPGACTIDPTDPSDRYRAATAEEVRDTGREWWRWLPPFGYHAVGVVDGGDGCISPPQTVYQTVIHMDDEDNRNANSRSGWIGAVSSGNDTTWRFCMTDGTRFKPFATPAWSYDYAVLQLAAVCPPGSRSIKRRQDNQDGNNSNWSSGHIYPNVNRWPGNWVTYYCYFEAGSRSTTGYFTGFPSQKYSYGVFAGPDFPQQYARDYGNVYQDDEDNFNRNLWDPRPRNEDVIGGGRNTWRNLILVR